MLGLEDSALHAEYAGLATKVFLTQVHWDMNIDNSSELNHVLMLTSFRDFRTWVFYVG